MSSIRMSAAAIVCAIAAVPASAQAQEVATVTGRVTAAGGAPLPGASVSVQALGVGAIADASGNYRFTVPGPRITTAPVAVIARLIGYQPQTVQVTLTAGATATQNFALAQNPLRLGEIVVTGAGTTQRRERLGNVVNSVDSTSIRRSNETNIVNALAAKAPGVEVRSQSGEPGASSYIRIRGLKSIQSTGQPLFVVDGVPIDNSTYATGASTGSTVAPNRASDLNPNDIESVEILKGSAAAAIYGARAAQGVVLITTKKGRAGETRYGLSSTFSVDQANREVPLQRRFGQGSGGRAATCAALDCRVSPSSFGAELAGDVPTYDQFNAVLRDGFSSDQNITASGGTERTTFYLSGGRYDTRGILRGNNEYHKTNVRINGSHKLFQTFNVSGSAQYVDASGQFVQKGSNVSGLMLGALRTPPEFDNRQYLDTASALHRSYRFPRPSRNSLTAGRGYDNPFFVLNEMPATSELGRVLGNVTLDYTPREWLSVRYNLGGDYYSDLRLEALPYTASTNPIGQVTRADLNNYQINSNINATARRQFNANASGSVTLGQELNSRRYRLKSSLGTALVAPQPFSLNNTQDQGDFEFRSRVNTESYFGQAEVDLFDQLSLTAAVRNDGFSTFGASERRNWFPKVSGAWRFSQLIPGSRGGRGALSFGKARLAYGETGVEPNVYQTITALYTQGLFGEGFGDSVATAAVGGLASSTQLGNNSLRPERTREIEGGFDLGFFDQRADLEFTLYRSRSSDVILLAPQAPSTGFSQQLRNAAKIQNEGVEVAFNVRPYTAERFAIDFGVQYARNRNEVLDLLGAESVDQAAGTFGGSRATFTKGRQGGVLRGEDFVRCGITDDDYLDDDGVAIGAGCAGAQRGALYIGADGFPVYDATDRVISDPNPDWTGSLRSNVTLFGNLRIGGLLDVRQGGDVWNGTRGALYNFGTHRDTEIRGQQRTFGTDYYTEIYPTVAGPGAGKAVALGQGWFTGKASGFNGPAAQFIEDGSFVKLRELSIAYSFNQPVIQRRLGFNSIDLRLAGRNLKVWTDYSGIDPETNLAGAEVLAQGIDYFNNPQTRSFVLAFSLNR